LDHERQGPVPDDGEQGLPAPVPVGRAEWWQSGSPGPGAWWHGGEPHHDADPADGSADGYPGCCWRSAVRVDAVEDVHHPWADRLPGDPCVDSGGDPSAGEVSADPVPVAGG